MGHIENDASNKSTVACIFVAEVTFSLSLGLATIGGYAYRHTDWWEGLMRRDEPRCHDIYTKFHKDGSGIQKLKEGDTQTTHSMVIA
jgi:hypothetical protein